MNRLWMVVISVGLLAGCAGRETVENQSEAYTKHAGDPVERVRYERIRSWQAVGREMIMIDFQASGQYLFGLSHECHSRLQTTRTLNLRTQQPRVIESADEVIIDDIHRCRIVSMQPVNMRAVRDELAGRG